MTAERAGGDWPADCHTGIEAAIAQFRRDLPGWWYSLGECEKSCDASCGPTRDSWDIALIPLDERFNSGFHADLYQPSTLADALNDVRGQALEALAGVRGTGSNEKGQPSSRPLP